MIRLQKIKKYFNYPDRLRTIVSIITGIFIVIFNLISGFLIVYIFADVVLGIMHPGPLIMLLYFIPGIAAGAGVLIICIVIFELLLNGTEMEEYTYLRVVLLASIAAYLFILFCFILIVATNTIERMMTLIN